MANNSDGGIVLSVNIDSSEVSSDMKKVVKEINKQVQAEAKNLKAIESVNQAKEKTAQLQQKTEKAVYNSLEAESKALTAEKNLKIAKEKSTEAEAKKETAIWNSLKAEQSAVREEQKLQTDKTLGEQRIANLKESNEQKNANARALNDQKVENSRLQSEERIKGIQERNSENLFALEKKNADDVATKKILNTDKIATQSVLNTNKIAEAERLSEDKIATQKTKNEEKVRQENVKTAREIQKNNTQQILDEEKKKQAVEKTKQEILKTEKAQKSLNNATSKTTTFLKRMATTLGIAFSVRQLITFSNEASKLASTTEASVQRLGMLYGEYGQEVYDWANDNANALGMSKTVAYQAAAAYGNIFTTFADGKESADLTKDVLQATAVIASQTGRTYDETFEKIQSGLYGNTRAIDDLGISVRQSSLMQTEAYRQVSQNGQKSWNDLTDAELQQVRALAIVEQSTQKYGNDVLQSTALVRSQFSSAWEDFKATWGQVVNGILVPILSVLTKIINAITIGLSYVADFMGQTYDVESKTSQILSNVNGFSGGIDEATTSQKKYNKELNKSLAGFDELNTLDLDKEDNNSGGGGGGGVTYDYTTTKTTDKGGGGGDTNEATSNIKKLVGIIAGITGILLITIGILLCFFGSLPFGIGCIIAGVVMLGVVAVGISKGGLEQEQIMSIISTLLAFLGGALLAIGVFLCFMGSVPVGIACIIAGVASLVGSGVTGAKSDEKEVEDWLQKLLTVISGALIVLGVLLLIFGGFSPLGIGLIVAGAAVLVVTLINKSDTVSEEVRNWINAIFAIVSTAALVIGIILLCTGQVTPLSIGLVVVGAVGLVSEVAINWEFLKKKLQGWIGVVTGIVSGALLVLGIIILIASGGTALALGLALIIAGAAGLVTVVAVNWDKIKEKTKSVIKSIGDWISKYGLLVLGIIMCLTGAGIPVGIALIIKWAKDGAQKGLPVATAIVDKVKEIWERIKSFWNRNIARYFKLAWWKNLGKAIINGLISSIEKGLNFIIDKINTLSWKIPDWVPKIGGGTFGFNIKNVSIPRLAKGAVIPANKEFLAVLGDQKSGTNIEAPAKLIKQMAKEAILELGVQGQSNAQTVIPTINVPVYLNGRQIALAQRQAEQELGKQIVSGGFANAY